MALVRTRAREARGPPSAYGGGEGEASSKHKHCWGYAGGCRAIQCYQCYCMLCVLSIEYCHCWLLRLLCQACQSRSAAQGQGQDLPGPGPLSPPLFLLMCHVTCAYTDLIRTGIAYYVICWICIPHSHSAYKPRPRSADKSTDPRAESREPLVARRSSATERRPRPLRRLATTRRNRRKAV
jgi:hypothetical protein